MNRGALDVNARQNGNSREQRRRLWFGTANQVEAKRRQNRADPHDACSEH
jgi:hypothetical protein